MHFIAVHPGYVKALLLAGRIQHGVVARALGAKAEVIAHLHIAHTQTLEQDFVNEGLGLLLGQTGIKGQHHDLFDAAVFEFGQLVAQGGDPGWGQFGLVQDLGEVVAGVGLEGHHATGHAAMRRFTAQQGQHGLVAPVHAIEIANGQGAGRSQAGVVEAAKYLHGGVYCTVPADLLRSGRAVVVKMS